MGSRKTRLANEALRQNQAITAARDRVANRLSLALDVERLRSEFADSLQTLRQNQTEKFKEYYQERQLVRSNRKLEVLANQKTRVDEVTALLNHFNIQRFDMAKEQQRCLADHMNNLKSQNLLRCEQAQSESKSRREFLLELLDLDLG